MHELRWDFIYWDDFKVTVIVGGWILGNPFLFMTRPIAYRSYSRERLAFYGVPLSFWSEADSLFALSRRWDR